MNVFKINIFKMKMTKLNELININVSRIQKHQDDQMMMIEVF